MKQQVGKRFGFAFCALLVLSALSQPIFAHDIWLHADDFMLEKGDTLIVRQLVGAELDTDLSHTEKTTELPVLRDMTPRFALITAKGSVDLMGELPDIGTRPEVKPVVERKTDFVGLGLVAMEHAILYTEHTNQEFFEYLEHEGLERDKFEPQMGPETYQTEGYQRSLKSLVLVGDAAAGAGSESEIEVYDRVLGQPIEIIPLQNPYLLDPGDDLEVQVQLHGEPLASQQVKAYASDGNGPATNQQQTTNEDGVARLTLDRRGLWLIRLVHMAPCSERSNVDCQDTAWESYWSALSFELD